jgi:hypothetical protein
MHMPDVTSAWWAPGWPACWHVDQHRGFRARDHQTAKEESELDQFTADASFRGNRLFIWTMPLLGFLGTVYGVSYGIGGFAEFLRGEVTAEEIKVPGRLDHPGLGHRLLHHPARLVHLGRCGLPQHAGGARRGSHCWARSTSSSGAPDRAHALAKKVEFPASTSRRSATACRMADAVHGGARCRNWPARSRTASAACPAPGATRMFSPQAIAKAGDLIAERMRDFNLHYEVRVGELGEQLAGKLHTVSNDFREGTVNAREGIERPGRPHRDQATRQQLDLQAASQQTWSVALDQGQRAGSRALEGSLVRPATPGGRRRRRSSTRPSTSCARPRGSPRGARTRPRAGWPAR